MPSPSAGSTRRNRSRRNRVADLFNFISRHTVVGAVWVVAALLCVLVVVSDPMSIFSVADWTAPRSEPELARGLALTLIFGTGGLLALFLRRHLFEKSSEVHLKERSFGGEKAALLSRAGLVVMVVGLALIAGDWLASHRALPPGKLLLPLNVETEAYQVEQGAREIAVMLPMRMTLDGVRFGEEPVAQVRFSRPGQQTAAQEFWPGRSLDVQGLRFVFSGFAENRTALRAVISSSEENTVAAAGVQDDTVRVSLEGAGFRIVRVVENYMDVLGPAVQLEDEAGKTFWVFQRTGDLETPPTLAHALQLDEVQRVPAAVFTVTAVRPFAPFALGMVLFVLGWLLFLLLPERLARARRKEGDRGYSSLNRIESTHEGLDGEQRKARSILFVALAIPAGLVIGSQVLALSLGDQFLLRPSLSSTELTWFAQLFCWVAMATLLFAAGLRAETAALTKGGVVSALSVVAMLGAVIFVGLQRGGALGMGYALPLTSDGGAAFWHVPGVSALSSLQISAVTSASWVVGFAAVAIFGALAALVGVLMKQRVVALGGWAVSGVSALSAAITLLREEQVNLHDTSAFEALARRWLQANDFPGQLAARGELFVEGALVVDRLALVPEILAFFVVAAIAIAMLLRLLVRSAGDRRSEASAGPFCGRDFFVAAVLMGMMGWVLGLVVTLDRLGSVGVLAPMEWLGLSAVVFSVGVLLLGWRREKSQVECYLGVFGPALALAWLLVILFAGAVAGVLPGSSLSLLF